jgi:hypothetical protein
LGGIGSKLFNVNVITMTIEVFLVKENIGRLSFVRRIKKRLGKEKGELKLNKFNRMLKRFNFITMTIEVFNRSLSLR